MNICIEIEENLDKKYYPEKIEPTQASNGENYTKSSNLSNNKEITEKNQELLKKQEEILKKIKNYKIKIKEKQSELDIILKMTKITELETLLEQKKIQLKKLEDENISLKKLKSFQGKESCG